VKSASSRFLSLLLLLSLLAGSLPVFAAAQSYPIYESELTRCIAISSRLQAISTELRLSLTHSLERILSLETELSELRIELEKLRTKLDESESKSKELSAALESATVSLESLETSFSAYRKEVEAKMRSLMLERDAARVVAVISSILATVFIVSCVVK